MAEYQGFWSYVHDDDSAEGGRIAQLARDIQAQFELLKGEKLLLFLDRDDLKWGDEWRARIDGELESVAFFIPILTPRYFQSVECRREFNEFVQKADQLGVTDLVLPLLYVDVIDLKDDDPDDEMIQIVQRIQWEDFTEIRFEDRMSGIYRKKVSQLAEHLVEVNRKFEEKNQPEHDKLELQLDEDDDTPGIMDKIADMEDEMPKINETIEEITHCLNEFNKEAGRAYRDIQQANQRQEGAKGRVQAARKLAIAIRSPTTKVYNLGSKFTSQLHIIDGGIRELIYLANEADERESAAIEELFYSIDDLVSITNTSMSSVKTMVHESSQLERFSRDLRTPLRKMRTGLTALLEGSEIMNEWKELMVDRN